MTFQIDSAAVIRNRALENLRARYLAHDPPEDIDITEGSDAYNELDALSLEFEGLGLGAQEAAHRVLLRYQRGQDLDDSAEDDGTARDPATAARRVIRVSGPPSSTTPLAGATLGTAGGVRFTPVAGDLSAAGSITTDGGGDADIVCDCTTTGTVGNLVVGTVLTWSSAPTGYAGTGLVVDDAAAVEGEAAESDDALRDRLLLRRRERPGGGNRSYWWDLLRKVAGVGEAFVYRVMYSPAYTPDDVDAPALGVYTYRPNTLGAITVVPIGPAPTSYVEGADGMAAGFSRMPSYGLVTRMRGYMAGTNDVNGEPVSGGSELYPAHMAEGMFCVVPPAAYERDVVVSVQAATGWRWLPGDNAVDNGGTSTASVVVLSSAITTWRAGDRIAIADWSAHRTRGGWFLRTITNVNVGARAITLDVDLPGIPPATTPTKPDAVNTSTATSLWAAMREKTCVLFDGLGPGPAPTQSFRYPSVEDRNPSDLTRASLLRVALNTAGVSDATIALPASSETAPVGGLFQLREFRIERAP